MEAHGSDIWGKIILMGQKDLRLQLAYRVSVKKDSESIGLNSGLTMFRSFLSTL